MSGSEDVAELLPLVLAQLPELHRKPSLAHWVFRALRNAARRLPFISPVLARVAAVAVTARLAPVRAAAALTCVALAHALVQRRAAAAARALLHDLASAVRAVAEHGGRTEHVVILGCFLAEAKRGGDTGEEKDSVWLEDPVRVPATAASLSALLGLIAKFVPAAPCKAGTDGDGADVPEQADDAAALESSTLLWLSVGASARAAVINVAASHALLSGKCGAEVALVAAQVLHAALSPSAGAPLALPVRARIATVVAAVLRRGPSSKSLQKNADDSQMEPADALLLSVAQMSGSDECVDGAVWVERGIPAAVKDNRLIGERARVIARAGFAATCSKICNPRTVDIVNGEQASKRRRVNDGSCITSRPTQHMPRDLQRHSVTADGRVCARPGSDQDVALHALDKEFDAARGCESRSTLVRMLTRICSLCLDCGGVGAYGKVGNRLLDRLRWINLTKKVASVVVETLSTVRTADTRDVWIITVRLAAVGLELCVRMQSLNAEAEANRDAQQLVLAITNFLLCASEVLESDPGRIPLREASVVLWRLVDLRTTSAVEQTTFPFQVEESALLSICVKWEQTFANSTDDADLQKRAIAIRASCHVLAALGSSEASDQATSLLTQLDALVSAHKGTCWVLAAAGLYGIGDIICAAACCRLQHSSTLSSQVSPPAQPRKSVGLDQWMTCYRLVEPVVRGVGADGLIGGATYCLGRLVLHAPPSRVGIATATLVQALWHPTSKSGRLQAMAALSLLAPSQIASVGCRSLSEVPRSSSLLACEDSWDGPERAFVPTGDGGGEDVARILGLELQTRLSKATNMMGRSGSSLINNGNVSDTGSGTLGDPQYAMDVMTLALLCRYPGAGNASTKIVAMATEALLSAAAHELSEAHVACAPEEIVNDARGPSSFQAWDAMVMTASHFIEAGHGHADNRSRGSVSKMYAAPLVNGTSLIAAVSEPPFMDQSLCATVAIFLNARLKSWLPLALERMLSSEAFCEELATILLDASVDALWKKVPKFALGAILRDGNSAVLDALVMRLGTPRAKLVEKVCADALARSAIMSPNGMDIAPDGANRLIYEALQQPLDIVVQRRAGKIVQRIVMELGGDRDAVAHRALRSVAKILPLRQLPDLKQRLMTAGELVADHFMLVMDAVNRGLFLSRVSERERLRFLRMLDAVLRLTQDHLHLFVPKILATLKMSLETKHGDERFRVEALRVWGTFLRSLGARRAGPHVNSILAILLPLTARYREIIPPMLHELIVGGGPSLSAYLPDIVSLFRTVTDPSLQTISASLKEQVPWAGVPTPPHVAPGDISMPSHNESEFAERCKNIMGVVSQHESGAIRSMALEHLLVTLRANRSQLGTLLTAVSEERSSASTEEVSGAMSMVVTTLTKQLSTSDGECQKWALQCLGELGAIDPALVLGKNRDCPSSSGDQQSSQNYPKGVHALTALLLERHLVPALIGGDRSGSSSSRLNRVGLAIQELLRVCGCRQDTPSRSRNVRIDTNLEGTEELQWSSVLDGGTEDKNAILFWAHLPENVRVAAQPYLDEPFDVGAYAGVFGGHVQGNLELMRSPAWAKVKATTPLGTPVSGEEWRRQLVVQLVDFIGHDGSFGHILKSLRPVLRREDSVVAYVFPLAVTTALDMQKECGSAGLLDFLVSEIRSVLQSSGTSPQPVFALLDTLRRWRDDRTNIEGRKMALEQRQRQSSGGAGGQGTSRRRVEKQPLQVLVSQCRDKDPLSMLVDIHGLESSQMSLLVQAQAAFAARAYPRAVMLAEYHIRNLRVSGGNRTWSAFVPKLLGGDGRSTDKSSATNSREQGHHSTLAVRDEDAESEALDILQRAYAELEDPDSMAGIAALRHQESLSAIITDAEASGSFDDALLSYERAMADSPRDEKLHAGFLRCLRTLGHWETMLAHAEGLVSSSSISEGSLRQSAQALGIEAAWRLGRWERVEQLTEQTMIAGAASNKGVKGWHAEYEAAVGQMLMCVRRNDKEVMSRASETARSCLLGRISIAATEGYSRVYPIIVQLHSLADIADAIGLSETYSPREGPRIRNALVTLDSRSDATGTSLRVREPILSTRRVCLELLGRKTEAAKVSLQLAKLARESKNLRAASASAFQALSTAMEGDDAWFAAATEMAHIQRARGDAGGALLKLKKGIERMTAAYSAARAEAMSDRSGGASSAVRVARAATIASGERLCNAHVLAGQWIEEARSEPSDVILWHFQTAAELGSGRVEPFYALGRHYDSLLQAGAAGDSDSSLAAAGSGGTAGGGSGRSRAAVAGGSVKQLQHMQYVPLVIQSFAKALCHGHTRIYEALPRLLTVWFDYYTQVANREGHASTREIEASVKRESQLALGSIPKYMWMTVISQLMSRILHPSTFVREELSQLLVRLVTQYTDQCVWTVLPSSQLRAKERRDATSSLLQKALHMAKKQQKSRAESRKGSSAKVLRDTMQSALHVLKELIDMCETQAPKEKRGRKDNCFAEFIDLRKHLGLASVIVPTLGALTVALPRRDGDEHRPFAAKPVRIVSIEDTVLVMSSLMRPRRVAFVGSDGHSYKFLAKKETAGDMRKDSRLVDFVTVVNRLLSKDSSSRERDLHLKTYAVLPLTEETGLIEWVNDLSPLRTLVREEQSSIPNLPDTSAISARYNSSSDKQKFLEDWALVKFPAVLDKFFVRSFGGGGDPQSWLSARNLWTRSVAVWSMAGYAIGLGDRHGENILIETTTGRCVHVDFAMLFDKGLTLKVPEIVPFRLTQNMVVAMGVSGYEGMFRVVCEIVLGILRNNSDALMGVLESFLYDPLADWTKGQPAAGGHAGGSGMVANKYALEMRRAVKAKLTGIVDDSGIPLSIQGQVQRLIHQATSTENLSKMYVWWGAWF